MRFITFRFGKVMKNSAFIVTYVFVGVIIGFILWGNTGRNRSPLEAEMYRLKTKEWIDRNTKYDQKKQQSNRRDMILMKKLNETMYMEYLLEEKLKALSESGLLRNIEEKRACLPKEHALSLCKDLNCTESTVSKSSHESISAVRKPLKMIGGTEKLREIMAVFDVKPTKTKYVFLTAASANHFVESQALLQSLYENVFPHINNYSLIYYDLGLTRKQRREVQDFTGAEFKTFPFDKLPNRFRNLKCFLWKPLIVLSHFSTAEFLVWLDTSVYFADDARPYFQKLSETGIMINRNTHAFAQHVYLKMFSYFGDEACQFAEYGELEGGFLILHNEPFVRHLVLEPWSACAVDESCMCPEETKTMSMCADGLRKYGKCHRFDQSALSYILIKLFKESVESLIVKNKVHSVKRGQGNSFLTDVRLGRRNVIKFN